MTQHSYLLEEKCKMKAVIDFRLDAQRYGNKLWITTESCTDSTSLVGDLVKKAEAQGYIPFMTQKEQSKCLLHSRRPGPP